LPESTDLPQSPNTTTSPDNLSWIFCEGEKVRVDSDESVAKKLQDESVGWHDDMRHVNNRFLFSAAPGTVLYWTRNNKCNLTFV